MRVPRIYQHSLLECGQDIQLDARAHKHLVQVLRLNVDHEIILFNGQGKEFKAKLTEATKREARALITECIDVNRETACHIHLAQCVSKGDRFEFALQKAVELGVDEITPVFSKRSQLKLNDERKEKKQRHWQQVIINAAEQSGRTRLTQLNEAQALPEFVHQQVESPCLSLILDPQASQTLSDIKACGHYRVLIGPEGGFEEEEINLAQHEGFSSISMGKLILRTETAPVAVLAALNFLEKAF